jgi:hypothetical protein
LTSIKPFDKAFFSFTIMKKIIFFILVFVAVQSFGQNRFPSIDSAKNYSLRYIRNSTVESFTNLRMQNVVYGTLELLDSLAGAGVIDTIFKSGDTLKYKIGSTTFTVGTFGTSTDSTVYATKWFVGQNYVPYTGATSNVDLNGNSLNAKSLSITGTGGNGHLNMRFQSSTPSGIGNHTTIYADATGLPYYKIDGASPVQIGSTYTAGNGLTLSGSEFRLGGTLSVNTQIISPFLNDFTLTTRGSSGDNNRSDLLMQNGSLFAYGYSGGSPNRTISISSSILQMATDASSAYFGAPNIYFQSGFSSGAAYAQTTTDTTTFKPLVLNTSTGLVSRLTSWPTGGSTPNLQAVTDVGNTTTNPLTTGNLTINEVNGGDPNIASNYNSDDGVGRITFFNTKNSGLSELTFSTNAGAKRYAFPDTLNIGTPRTDTIPVSFKINGITKKANTNGLVDLGTIGGISDTSRIVTTDKTQSITGRKTFNAATFINKDSLPITTGRRWAVVVDTTNNRLSRQDLNIYRRDLDTIPLATFTVGSAAAGDTAAFSTSTLAGSFYLDGTDTLFVTSYRVALQGTTPSITPEVWFNDSLNVTAGGTRLATGSAITNTTTGTSVTATTNKIPQGNFVFVRFSAVATKPTYFTLTLFGYRIRKA